MRRYSLAIGLLCGLFVAHPAAGQPNIVGTWNHDATGDSLEIKANHDVYLSSLGSGRWASTTSYGANFRFTWPTRQCFYRISSTGSRRLNFALTNGDALCLRGAFSKEGNEEEQAQYRIDGRWCFSFGQGTVVFARTGNQIDVRPFTLTGQPFPNPPNFISSLLFGEPGPAPFQIIFTYDPARGPWVMGRPPIARRTDFMRFVSETELELSDQHFLHSDGQTSRDPTVILPLRMTRC